MPNIIHNLNTEELDYIIKVLSQRSDSLNLLINNYRRKALEITEFNIWEAKAREMLNDQITQSAQKLELASSLMVSLSKALSYYKEQLESLTNDNMKDISRIDGGINETV